jgi:hypothetical protein
MRDLGKEEIRLYFVVGGKRGGGKRGGGKRGGGKRVGGKRGGGKRGGRESRFEKLGLIYWMLARRIR